MSQFIASLIAQALELWNALGESGKHLVVMVFASAVTGLVTWIGIRWRAYMYGKTVHVHVSWLEQVPSGATSLLSKILWRGPALELLHSKSASRTLVRASRWKKGLMDKGSWNKPNAERILGIIADHVSRQFAAGAIARAMGDKDVTCGMFCIGAYNEGGEISINLILAEHLVQMERLPNLSGGDTLPESLAMQKGMYCMPENRLSTVMLYM